MACITNTSPDLRTAKVGNTLLLVLADHGAAPLTYSAMIRLRFRSCRGELSWTAASGIKAEQNAQYALSVRLASGL